MRKESEQKCESKVLGFKQGTAGLFFELKVCAEYSSGDCLSASSFFLAKKIQLCL
jgi:hypothetical protein